MKISKKIAKISWIIFNVLWLFSIFLLDSSFVPMEGLMFFFQGGTFLVIMFFVMPFILILFNILYLLLYKTKNYLASLILTLMFLGIGVITLFL